MKTIIATALLALVCAGASAKQIRVEFSGYKTEPASFDLKSGVGTIDCTASEATCFVLTIITADMAVNPEVGDPTVVEVYDIDGTVTNRVTGKYVSLTSQPNQDATTHTVTLTNMIIVQ